MALLEVRNVQKIYTTRFGKLQVQALSNVSFSVEEGEFVAPAPATNCSACSRTSTGRDRRSSWSPTA